MQLRNRIFAAILIPAAVLSIALPAVTLFTGDGFLAPYIRTPEAAKMLPPVWSRSAVSLWTGILS